MKNLFFVLAFMLVGTIAFANVNDATPHAIEIKTASFNENATNEIRGAHVFKTVNDSSEHITSLKCWLFKRWLKRELRKVSDDDELIDETVDTLKELCEIANDLGWLD